MPICELVLFRVRGEEVRDKHRGYIGRLWRKREEVLKLHEDQRFFFSFGWPVQELKLVLDQRLKTETEEKKRPSAVIKTILDTVNSSRLQVSLQS